MTLKYQHNIAIIGAGRFGKFWGKHISKFHSTFFYDVDSNQKKQISRYAKWCSLEDCLSKKIIFLTIPIGKLSNFLKENAQKISPGSVLVDCASVKVPVLKWFEKYLPENVYYVASHPLFGPDSAKNKLKENIIVLMPGRVQYEDYNFLVHLFSNKLGLHVYNMSARQHDELMAYNLNLVHYLGRSLNNLGISRLPLLMSGLDNLNEIVGVVMNDSQELFLDFYHYNPFAESIHQKWLKSMSAINKQVSYKKARK